ncbi:MAG: 16S rRNA (uracil(1498)-N(3))-methyltransferase [Spirochaetes bacterium]|nr:16S rRNA (uracil(1498)-N(3))-methyltransferase [Spirochaetota bacterium]
MPQFFIHSSDIIDGRCRISGDDFRHLASVRRVKAGEEIRLRDDSGAVLSARIVLVTDDSILAEITGRFSAPYSLPDITLCMSLLKGKNFDQVIEKGVEIGVARIVPVVSERTITRPTDASARVERWNRKSEEAAKQSLRERIPRVERIMPFEEVIASVSTPARVIAHPGAQGSIKEFLRNSGPSSISLLVGPEGGFSLREVADAAGAGWTPAGFGFSQLRAGTAAAVLCGIIVYEWGDPAPRPPLLKGEG